MKIICVGRNYKEYIKELGNQENEDMVFFFKPDTAYSRDKEEFYLPDYSSNVQYECEVVVKIDKVGKSIPEKYASNYYSYISLGIDYTLRDWQQKEKEASLPWTISKCFDYSSPVGEFILLGDIKKTIDNIDFYLKKNDVIVQRANTKQMIYHVDKIIAYISKYITLKTGDLIFTGTPQGVGNIQIGDVLTGYIENKQVFQQKIR